LWWAFDERGGVPAMGRIDDIGVERALGEQIWPCRRVHGDDNPLDDDRPIFCVGVRESVTP